MNNDRDQREVTLYDDDVLEIMQGWTGGIDDPLYAISSTGGRNYAWVFQDAIANLDSDIRRVHKVGRNQYQLGKGIFTKKEIDELHQIRDALQYALEDVVGVGRTEEARHIARDFSTLPEIVQHEQKHNGASHVLVGGRGGAWVFYPEGASKFSVGQLWQERGYWHSPAPSARSHGRPLDPKAEPIDTFLGHARRGLVAFESH